MKILTTILFLSLAISGTARSESKTGIIKRYMVIAKVSGMCGLFTQMARFQETTKMEGGDEFITRFLATEATRLGHTSNSFIKACPKVTEDYKVFMEALNESEDKK